MALYRITRTVKALCSRLSTSTDAVRRFYQRYERQRWKNNANSSSFLSMPIVAAAFVGGNVYVLLKKRHEVNCEDETHQITSENATEEVKSKSDHLSFHEAVLWSEELLQRVKLESASPGLVVSVSVDGNQVWCKGYGLADVENVVPCKPSTVMRIASISKPLTMVAVARLWEEGKLDLDESIQRYVPSWPDKSFHGEKVTISSRQLVSMMAGIRHYEKQCSKVSTEEVDPRSIINLEKSNNSNEAHEKKEEMLTKRKRKEFDNQEYYIKEFYPSIDASLELFKNDELCSMPGTEFLYSTYAWNLVSAVVEGASGGKKFTNIMKDLFYDLGLENTYLDENVPIIHNRARNYVIDKKSRRLMNVRYVDNSYKWAGGGFLSTAPDLCHFGNVMLYSYQWSAQQADGAAAAGYLKPDTVRMLWTPVKGTRLSWDRDGSYAMGWGVVPAADPDAGPGRSRNRRHYVGHTGGAIGASSALVILPRTVEDAPRTNKPPQGVVVAIIVNMESVSLNKTALKIAKFFDAMHVD